MDIWKALLSLALSNVNLSGTVDAYKEKLKAKVRATDKVKVIRWRIFGWKIRWTVTVTQSMKDDACREIDRAAADAVEILYKKLQSLAE